MKRLAEQIEIAVETSPAPALVAARAELDRQIKLAREWAKSLEDGEYFLSTLDNNLLVVANGIGDWGHNEFRELRDAILRVRKLELDIVKRNP